ncbi:hypothetical protein BDFB_014368, partial [Asbolus verrucosus]
VHQLREADYPVRAEYCRWFLITLNENLLKSFFIDEVWFYLEGYIFSTTRITAHTIHEALNMVQKFFNERVISRNTPILYPSRFCDLTP